MVGPLVVLLALMFATYAGIRAASAADRREACRCGRALDGPGELGFVVAAQAVRSELDE